MNAETLPCTPVHETPFTIRVDRQADAAVVYAGGSCTMTVSKRLADTLREVGGENLRVVVLDLTGLDFIESSGLGGIVAGYLRARLHKGELRVVNPTPDIRKLLEMTRLVQLFPIYPSIEAALGDNVAARMPSTADFPDSKASSAARSASTTKTPVSPPV
ncbi:MAG TPA: STAS domain-containing protein [Phycisphaerae bacterium]|nr:STAS domain-containing protein [Phycisphaerae bacterium]